MKLLNFFIKTIKPFKIVFSGIILCVVLNSFSVYGWQWSAKYLTDALTESAHNMSHINNVYKCLFMLALVFIAYEITSKSKDYLQLSMIPKLKKNIVDELCGGTLSYAYDYFGTLIPTKFVYSVFQVAESTADIFIDYAVDFLRTFFTLTLACITLFQVNTLLGYLGIVWIVLWMFTGALLARKTYNMSYELSDLRSSLSAKWNNTFENIDSVFVYNGRKVELDKNMSVSHNVMKQDKKLATFIWRINVVQGIVAVIVTVTALLYMVSLFKQGKSTTGDFILVAETIHSVIHYLWEFAQDLSWLITDIGRIRQGLDMSQSAKIQKKGDTHKVNFNNHDIHLENVSYRYDNKVVFQHENTLSVPQGSNIALVGSSGSGKTTFIKMILGLIDPESGHISIGQNNIQNMNENELRENFALIPQDPKVLDDTILHNIQYGSFNATKDEVIAAAKKAQIHDFIMSLPLQYETIIKNSSMSGGQRQRLMIARGLLRNAKIFIFDESTSALDTITEKDILNAIEEIDNSKTKIIIAHRLYTIRHADIILVFNDGKIVQQGSHDELIKQGGLYKKLYEIQMNS